MLKCERFQSDHVRPGWICCRCKSYNGKDKLTCWSCAHELCKDPTENNLVTPKPRRGRPPSTAKRATTWAWKTRPQTAKVIP